MATEKHVQIALQKVETKLSKYPNVVGLGVVSSAEDVSGADAALGVYVQKLSKAIGKRGCKIPGSVTIKVGARTLKVPIRIIEQGEVQLERP